MSETVLVETAGATRIVTINRPEARNALTRTVIAKRRRCVARRIGRQLHALRRDRRRRRPLLRGGRPAAEHYAEDPDFAEHLEDYMDAYHALIKAVVRCQKPTVAMMDGGRGRLRCGPRFCVRSSCRSDRAYVQERFVQIGLMPDGGGTFWLPRLVGTARAMQMILLADKVEARELLGLGVVARVVEPNALRESTLSVARLLEVGPPLAFAAIKRSLYASWGSIEDALRREREEQLRLLRSADAMEGVTAWTQKREPRFEGR